MLYEGYHLILAAPVPTDKTGKKPIPVRGPSYEVQSYE